MPRVSIASSLKREITPKIVSPEQRRRPCVFQRFHPLIAERKRSRLIKSTPRLADKRKMSNNSKQAEKRNSPSVTAMRSLARFRLMRTIKRCGFAAASQPSGIRGLGRKPARSIGTRRSLRSRLDSPPDRIRRGFATNALPRDPVHRPS